MSEFLRIKDMLDEEKPREKMIALGPGSLTDAELLSMILRTGGNKISVLDLARDVLKEFNGLHGLIKADISEINKIENIDKAKSCAIKSCFEIALRVQGLPLSKETIIKTPNDVYQYTKKDFASVDIEQLIVISLNSRNKVTSKTILSKGTLNETLIHPRDVFRWALTKNACSIILVHNHPSESSEPSQNDIEVTKRIAQVGVYLGIPLMDHVIVTSTKHASLKALGVFKKFDFKKGGDKNE